MCCIELVHKTGLSRLGDGMEGTLHFLASFIIVISVLRLAVFLAFGI